MLVRAYWNAGNKEAAYKTAESLYIINPQSGLAIDVMCRKAINEKNWKSLEKWGKKGYDLDTLTGNLQAEIAYHYAKGLYENGNKYEAKNVYNRAIKIDGKHWLRNEYTIIGGTPCKIKSLLIQNSGYDDSVINKAGSTIYDDKTEYLVPVVCLEPLRTGYFDFKIKLYVNGNLQKEKDKDADYTYIYNALIISNQYPDDMIYYTMTDDHFHLKTERDTINQTFGGWGNDKPGTWSSGVYRVEIWWENEQLASYSFNIYSSYWHDLGFGNRFD